MNLAAPPTTLIGRDQELTWVLDALRRPDVRLLTLTGPGGTGKTRLAAEAATELAGHYPDGVVFVSLAPVIDHSHVPSAIAQAVGARESGELPALEEVKRHLQELRSLLILDNFEHVVAAATIVAELLAACPGVDFLVTSRIALRIRGEREYPLSPLPLPDARALASVEALERNSAVALFIERARDVSPSFELSADNAAAVAQICARLDGLPLAIELAAARTRMLPPAALLGRLEHRLALLTGGARDLPDRQQTLRNAVAWSYDLLGEDEQKLYRRLSVFRGGWTLEAADAVAGSPASGELDADVFEGLSALIDHNIVRLDEGSDDEPRFTMLETIREYGLERLAEAGEAAEARERHAGYYADLATRAEPELTGASQQAWLERLEREHDNVRAALTWSLDDPDHVETGVRLATSIWRFWAWHGHVREGRDWLQRCLDRCDMPGTQGSRRYQVKGLNAAGVLDLFLGEVERSATLHQACLDIARELEDEEHIAKSLGNLGVVAHKLGRYEEAARWHQEILAVAERRDDQWTRSLALHNFGVTLFALRDYEEAARRSNESLSLSKRLGNESSVAKALMNLTQVALLQGDDASAERHLDESLARSRQLGNRLDIADGLWLRAEIARRRSERAQAAELFRESLALFQEQGALDSVARCLEGLGLVACGDGAPLRATALLAAAEALCERTKSPLLPPYRVDHERAVEALRRALDTEAFEARWSTGAGLSLEQAVDLALDTASTEPHMPVEFAVVADGAGAQLSAAPATPSDAARYGITPREYEVIELLVQGLTNQEIADQLFITRRTATTHVSNILNKLGLDSRTAIVAWAVREGLA